LTEEVKQKIATRDSTKIDVETEGNLIFLKVNVLLIYSK